MTNTSTLSDLDKARANLKCIDYGALLKMINHFPFHDVFCITIPVNSMIFRARPNEDSTEFKCIDQISYPKQTNKFGRANRPGNPMFYGTVTPPESDNIENMATIIAESMEIFRSKLCNYEEKKLTLGRWFTNEMLILIGMIFNYSFPKDSVHFLNLSKKYSDYLLENRNDQTKIRFFKLISNEFSKPNIADDNDYKISSAFVEAVMKSSNIKIDGILYPSVRTEGQFFNIALTPECVNTKMRIEDVFTTWIYYKNNCITNYYEKEAHIEKGEKEFHLKEILDQNINMGKENTLRQLDNEIVKKIILK